MCVLRENNGSKIKLTTNTSKVKTPIQYSTRSDIKAIDFGSFHSIVLINDGTVYTGGRVYASHNVAGNATFLSTISGSWKYTEDLILMDDVGNQGRVIELSGMSSNSYMMMDNGSIVCTGSNSESQCTNTNSSSGNQISPLIMEGM